MAQPTAIVSHPACALHDTGWAHPEHQGRLPAVVKGLYAELPALVDRVLMAEAEAAEDADLLRVHTQAHVDRIRQACALAGEAGHPLDLTLDTIVSGASWDAALGASGAAIHGARLVLGGDACTAFVLTRPPGHHATADRAMGFCLFNNVAVAARWAQAEVGVERVLIVDWDVHHGNGTQDIFYTDPSVYYLSLHLAGHYPGTGHTHQKGAGAGRGTTRNVTFPHGVEREYYVTVYDEVVAAAVRDFAPDLVLVSAGFDVLHGDPLGGLALEPTDLHHMAQSLVTAATPTGGRVVAVLEGGYVPRRVSEGVVQVVRAFAGLPPGLSPD
jgi:acetoin utilization deacetylase AcuC-like enzyme